MNFNTIRNYYWRTFGYPDLPPKNMLAKPKLHPVNKDKYIIGRKEWMYFYYSRNLLTIEQIAEHYNVTRERVRQCLWKVWRENA